MSQPNEVILQKADLALADLASAGRLSTTQARQFIRTVIDSPTIINEARVVEMPSDTHKINKIGFGSRIMRAAPNEGVALADSQRSKPTLSSISLTAKEVIAEVRLPYSVIEDNIEGGSITGDGSAGGIMDTLLALIGERAAVDLEELALLGDTSSSDAYLALFDGWLKLCSTHIVAAPTGGALTKEDFSKLLKTLPSKYHRNIANLRYYMSTSNAIDASDIQGARQTALGDAQVTGMLPTTYHGVKVAASPMMPESDVLFTDPKNLILGIHRDIFIEYEKLIRERTYAIVITARIAVAVEEPDASVHMTSLHTVP